MISTPPRQLPLSVRFPANLFTPEQPDAPSTDVNTASQHPTLDGEPKNASSVTAVHSVKSTDDTPSGLAGANNPNYAAEASNPGSLEKKPSQSTEQRSSSQTEAEDASSTGESSTRGPAPSHDVSKEALKGPQGPAPHPAEEYEKEAKGGKPKKAEEPAKSSESTSSPSKNPGKSEQGTGSGNGGGSGSGNSGASEKSGTMSKVKETLHKVAHPRHGNKE